MVVEWKMRVNRQMLSRASEQFISLMGIFRCHFITAWNFGHAKVVTNFDIYLISARPVYSVDGFVIKQIQTNDVRKVSESARLHKRTNWNLFMRP